MICVFTIVVELDLTELKSRAFQVGLTARMSSSLPDSASGCQHIVKSLTVTNVAYEVFSSFSATFEDVRKAGRTLRLTTR